MDLNQGAYFRGDIESSNCKSMSENMKIVKISPRENHTVALSYQKKSKIKDTSDSENLSKAPKDGGFNLPTSEY